MWVPANGHYANYTSRCWKKKTECDIEFVLLCRYPYNLMVNLITALKLLLSLITPVPQTNTHLNLLFLRFDSRRLPVRKKKRNPVKCNSKILQEEEICLFVSFIFSNILVLMKWPNKVKVAQFSSECN